MPKAPEEMRGDGPKRVVSVFFRLLIRGFPRRFREGFGEEMREVLRAGYRTARRSGRMAAIRFVVWSAADVLGSGLKERLYPTWPEPTTRRRRPARERSMGTRGLDVLSADIRFSVRSLLRRPAFTSVVVLTLALGTGVNAAIFTVVHGVLLEPLAYPQPDRIVTLWWTSAKDPEQGRGQISELNIDDAREADVLQSLVGIAGGDATLTGMGEPVVVEGARVTGGLLSTFGLAPAMGRDIRREEAVRGGPRVVVVSDRFWRSRLGGSDAVGTTLTLNGESYEIVGVAPPDFDFPEGTDLWRPADYSPMCAGARACRIYGPVVGRLAPNASFETAKARLRQLGSALATRYPETNQDRTFNVVPLQEAVVGDVRADLWILMGAVVLVLLIACSNVASLLLVRAESRESEVSVRRALGASRSRLLVQVAVESLVLAISGSALGLGLAELGLRALRGASGIKLPRIADVTIDGTVLVFALVTALVVSLLFGSAPAMRVVSSRADRGSAARGGSRSGGQGRARLRRGILAIQVGFSVVLLVGTGLLLRSLATMYGTDLGYDPQGVYRFNVSPSGDRYESPDVVRTFYSEIEAELAALPDVEAVGSILVAPLSTWNTIGTTLSVDGSPALPVSERPRTYVRSVTPGYFDTLRLSIVRGRRLLPSDQADSDPAAVVNEALAHRVFPGVDPIGKRIHVDSDMGWGSPTWTIVGIVGDIRSRRITSPPPPEVYLPHAQFGAEDMTVQMRYKPGATPNVAAVRNVVHGLDPNIPISVEALSEGVKGEAAPTRFYLALIGLFGALALTLTAVGLHGVIAYLVSRRTREIGIRVALGASGGRVVRLALGQGFLPVAIGLAAGVLAAVAGSRVMSALLYEVEPRDPLVFGAVTIVVAVTSLIAILQPARRAGRVDPAEALRTE